MKLIKIINCCFFLTTLNIGLNYKYLYCRSDERAIYSQNYYNISEKLNADTAIVVISYNRPHYFKKVLESLEKNAEAEYLPFFFFLDGGVNSTQLTNVKLIKAAKKIKHQEFILRKENYGCGKNIIDARRFMFDWCGFKKIIVFEDDLIVSPYYIRLTLNLYEWAKKNLNHVGISLCSRNCKLAKQEKKNILNKVEINRIEYLWGYCIDRDTWDSIKPLIYEYEKIFLDKEISYSRRNHHGIRIWMNKKVKDYSKENYLNSEPGAIAKSFVSNPRVATGQDAITLLSLFLNGKTTLSTAVNRSRYIGKFGIHCNARFWNKQNFNLVSLDLFEEDKNIQNFEIK